MVSFQQGRDADRRDEARGVPYGDDEAVDVLAAPGATVRIRPIDRSSELR